MNLNEICSRNVNQQCIGKNGGQRSWISNHKSKIGHGKIGFRASMTTINIITNWAFLGDLEKFEKLAKLGKLEIFSYVDVSMTWGPRVR